MGAVVSKPEMGGFIIRDLSDQVSIKILQFRAGLIKSNQVVFVQRQFTTKTCIKN